MRTKPLKSWRTLASEAKARRKAPITPGQIERLNKIFEDLAKERDRPQEDSKRRIARQQEV